MAKEFLFLAMKENFPFLEKVAQKSGGWIHSRSKQRVLVLTYTQIFSPKKTGFSPVKNTSQRFFDICLPLFYATFQCGRYNIFKKKKKIYFLPMKT